MLKPHWCHSSKGGSVVGFPTRQMVGRYLGYQVAPISAHLFITHTSKSGIFRFQNGPWNSRWCWLKPNSTCPNRNKLSFSRPEFNVRAEETRPGPAGRHAGGVPTAGSDSRTASILQGATHSYRKGQPSAFLTVSMRINAYIESNAIVTKVRIDLQIGELNTDCAYVRVYSWNSLRSMTLKTHPLWNLIRSVSLYDRKLPCGFWPTTDVWFAGGRWCICYVCLTTAILVCTCDQQIQTPSLVLLALLLTEILKTREMAAFCPLICSERFIN